MKIGFKQATGHENYDEISEMIEKNDADSDTDADSERKDEAAVSVKGSLWHSGLEDKKCLDSQEV